MKLIFPVLVALTLIGCSGSPEQASERSPNVIVVMTDDQGYGDIASHGNTMIQTPNLDRLRAESVRLTDFHVDPTCSPTRSALMTGRYSSRTGVWHTIMGRSIMAGDEVTIGDVFSKAGYRTGMFGKWHLGDNYPTLPENHGFQEVVRHGGGGVAQAPDYWGNDYFDDTYWHNGKTTPYKGYCTDVFFREAMRFITESKDKPFLVYLPTNAPHGPYFVDEKYSKPYEEKGVPKSTAAFYGMITNIDENMGLLMAQLDELGLRENTILIFMTDNGTAQGVSGDSQNPGGTVEGDVNGEWQGYNAGMRGKKGSEYEGGHRVPFFIRWPAAGIGGGRDIDTLSAHIDVLPTLVDLTGIAAPSGLDWDGASLASLLRGKGGEWPERTLLVHSQRIEHPEKWRKSAVMTERWRLVNGEELYDLEADPSEKRDVALENGEVVASLRQAYEKWWEHIDDRFDEQVHIVFGNDHENPARITSHDWHPLEGEMVPWNHRQIEAMPMENGIWYVDVDQPGTYELSLYHQDKPAKFPLEAKTAKVKIGEAEAEAAVEPGADHVNLTLELKAGKTTMQTWLTNADGQSRGAFYVYVVRK